jgi:transposase
MSIRKTRRRYTKEFKKEAVRLVRSRDGHVTDVAKNLGIHSNMLRRWMSEFDNDPNHSFPGNGNLRAPDEQIRQLQKKLRDVEEERDILKEALAIFSKKKP